MNLRSELKQLGLLMLSPEFRAVSKIIRNPVSARSEMNIDCDSVFTERLRTNFGALRMKFWRSHFEWQDLLSLYPEIDGTILDFGCGSGHSDILLARTGKKVCGLDLSPMGIQIAEYYRRREPQAVQDNLRFELCDIRDDNAREIQFDSAWSSHVFEHIRDPGPVIAGVRRNIKPGAPLLISVPYERAYDDPGHVHHFFSPGELRHFLAPHISVEKVDLHEEHRVLRALCRNK